MTRYYHKTARLLGVGLFCFLAVGTASAQSISISPTGIQLDENNQIGTFTLSNSGERETTVHARAYRWAQEGSEDRLDESNHLLLAPPIFSLAPGESQVVRVGYRRSIPASREKSYRVEFQEVLPDERAAPGVGLRLALRISVPVFVQPLESGEADLSWHARYDRGNSEAVIQVENTGRQHARLTRMALVDTDSGRISAQPGRQLVYLLAGAAREWRLPLEPDKADRAVLEVRGRSGSDDINVSLDLE